MNVNDPNLANSMHPKWHDDKPCIYIEAAGRTIQWLADRHDMNTVMEYNHWLGPTDLFERVAGLGTEITRSVVLMECDHNQILKINEEMYKGTVAMAECLEICRQVDGILGWDFRRKEPKITLHPCSDKNRKLTPLPDTSR